MIGFQSADLFGLLPALLLVLTGMAVLLLEVFQRASFPRTHLAYVTALGALLAAGVAYLIAPAAPQTLWGGMVRFDALGCVITAFTAVACAITALGSTRYLEQLEIDRGEYYALLVARERREHGRVLRMRRVEYVPSVYGQKHHQRFAACDGDQAP
jgi:NADH:ubiquinone oxidoreductase subunit 2 (subunit N)